MSRDGSPPDSWYDPPEPRHSSGTIIPMECHCEECHEWHIEQGLVDEQSALPDYPCCADQIETWFESGERCRKHPKAYAEAPCKENNFVKYCEECNP